MAAIKYPIYVISKGRWQKPLTANFLLKDNIDFKLVVEPQEAHLYEKSIEKSKILILPFSNLNQGSIPARNFVWQHSISQGFRRHWILDDNIRTMLTHKNGKRVSCDSKLAFKNLELFVERYQNIAIAGINYRFFCFSRPGKKSPPFFLNHHCYSCLLILNEVPFRWRGRYNEDTDLCLQALTNNYCTINMNVFLIEKTATMTCKGGNTESLYKGNGRLIMAQSLEHQWRHYKGLVKIIHRFNRPQHYVNWKLFKTALKKI